MTWRSDLWARVRGRQEPEEPDLLADAAEQAAELRLEARQEHERKIREAEPDKERYQDV